jgi:hypothetical protein
MTPTDQQAALLDCPFCRSSNVSVGGMIPWVECADCGACGPVHGTDAEAIAAWNTRATPTAADGGRAEAAVGYVTQDGEVAFYVDDFSHSRMPKPGTELYARPSPSPVVDDATVMRTDIGPQHFGVPVEHCDAARNYADYLAALNARDTEQPK